MDFLLNDAKGGPASVENCAFAEISTNTMPNGQPLELPAHTSTFSTLPSIALRSPFLIATSQNAEIIVSHSKKSLLTFSNRYKWTLLTNLYGVESKSGNRPQHSLPHPQINVFGTAVTHTKYNPWHQFEPSFASVSARFTSHSSRQLSQALPNPGILAA